MQPIDTQPKDYQWLFFDLNSYFASVEQQLRPELRGKPIAVVPALTDATCAIAASYEAKAYGIKTGTKIYEAKRLCPDLEIVLARHEAYVDFHHRILEELDRHIPVESVESIDEAACRLMGPQCCEQEAVAIARAIKAGLRDRVGECVRASIGIAPNKYLAKVATDLQKPDGLVVLRMADLPGPLLSMQLTDLTGIARGLSARLNRAGIFTVEQLWNLPPKHLRHIWGGVGGERYWYALHGIQLQSQPTQRRTLGHSHVLEPEYRPPAQAAIVAQRLLLKAASRLRRIGYVAQGMSVSIRLEHGSRLATDRRFHRTSDTPALAAILHDAWAELMKGLTTLSPPLSLKGEGAYQSPASSQSPPPLGGGSGRGQPRIKKISVTLHGLIPLDQVQPELFDDPKETARAARRASLSCALDTLNARFGRDTVTLGCLPRRTHAFSGTKIAFTRIPDAAEFHE